MRPEFSQKVSQLKHVPSNSRPPYRGARRKRTMEIDSEIIAGNVGAHEGHSMAAFREKAYPADRMNAPSVRNEAQPQLRRLILISCIQLGNRLCHQLPANPTTFDTAVAFQEEAEASA